MTHWRAPIAESPSPNARIQRLVAMSVEVCKLLRRSSMPSEIRLEVHEKRAPLWALAAPGIYLFAGALAVRAVLFDGAEVGIAGLLLAVGLLPAFAIPAVFTTRRARIAMTDDGLRIDGAIEKVDDARLERAERGAAVLHLVMRNGRTRSFMAPSYKDAQQLIAFLPPVSAPAGALVA